MPNNFEFHTSHDRYHRSNINLIPSSPVPNYKDRTKKRRASFRSHMNYYLFSSRTMLFSGSLKLDMLGIFVVLITILLAWHKWSLGYWKRKGIPGPAPSLLVGNAVEMIQGKKCMGEIFKDVYFGLKNKGKISRFF